jgi:hypothetical protein
MKPSDLYTLPERSIQPDDDPLLTDDSPYEQLLGDSLDYEELQLSNKPPLGFIIPSTVFNTELVNYKFVTNKELEMLETKSGAEMAQDIKESYHKGQSDKKLSFHYLEDDRCNEQLGTVHYQIELDMRDVPIDLPDDWELETTTITGKLTYPPLKGKDILVNEADLEQYVSFFYRNFQRDAEHIAQREPTVLDILDDRRDIARKEKK